MRCAIQRNMKSKFIVLGIFCFVLGQVTLGAEGGTKNECGKKELQEILNRLPDFQDLQVKSISAAKVSQFFSRLSPTNFDNSTLFRYYAIGGADKKIYRGWIYLAFRPIRSGWACTWGKNPWGNFSSRPASRTFFVVKDSDGRTLERWSPEGYWYTFFDRGYEAHSLSRSRTVVARDRLPPCTELKVIEENNPPSIFAMAFNGRWETKVVHTTRDTCTRYLGLKDVLEKNPTLSSDIDPRNGQSLIMAAVRGYAADGDMRHTKIIAFLLLNDVELSVIDDRGKTVRDIVESDDALGYLSKKEVEFLRTIFKSESNQELLNAIVAGTSSY